MNRQLTTMLRPYPVQPKRMRLKDYSAERPIEN